MTIVALDKVTLCGILDEKAAVLDALQGLGCLHLMTLGDKEDGSGEAPERAEHAVAALRYLLAVRDRRKQVRDERGFDFDLIVGKVLDNRRRRRELEDARDSLQRRIANLEPWGNFRFPPGDALAGHRLWFYRMPLRVLRRFDEVELPWQVVHRDNQEAYVVVISKQVPATGEVPAHRVRVGTVPLADLRARLESTELELEDVDAERHALSRWIHLIGRNLAVAEDRAALLHACAATRDEAPLFVVQGWLPRRDRGRLEAFARDRALALQVEAPAADDVPPTMLDNPPALAAGQDVVGFYQVPPYRSWDPSIVVFFSFAAFFAMIMADAGYALLLGAVLAYGWRGLGRTPARRRVRSLAAVILLISTVYGVLAGSYFGVAPAAGGVLAGLRILDVGDFATMMRLSVVIGCAHIALAAALRALNAGSLARAVPHLGWIAVLAGGLMSWLGDGGVRSAGFAVVGVALAAILAFSSERPVRTPKDVVLRLLGGLQALTSLSALFGDVLSYMRLFALGLASSSLAVTFNEMAAQVREALPGTGLLFGMLILLFGHAINLALALVSGFVHGLRLNFIEFFKWGIPGEGQPFLPFAKKEVQQ